MVVVDALEVIQVAQQQSHRLATAGAVGQQLFATGHEGAAVADAGQRVGIGGGLEFQLGALADHGQGHVGDADGVEHRLKEHEREETGAAAVAGDRLVQRHAMVGNGTHAVETGVHQHQQQRWQVGDFKLLAAAPQFKDRQAAIRRRQHRIHRHPQAQVVVETRHQPPQRPEQCAGQDPRQVRRAAGKHTHGGPVQRRAEQQDNVAQHQGDKVGGQAAQADQGHAAGGEQEHAAQVAEGPLAYAAAPGMQGQQAHQGKDENGHQQQGRDAQQQGYRSPLMAGWPTGQRRFSAAC
ncbi:hypothetical protein D9M71_488800 [compost metagenome]